MRRLPCLFVLLLLATVASGDDIITPVEHRRGEEQTFLTFPEWFLVFSPAEYADLVKRDMPSNFPFWGHVRQFWESYAAVTRATRERGYPFNGGYHTMIMVIGTSTTLEYAIRSAYESVFGRIAELTSRSRTAEDDYGAQVAQEYVDFIRVHPWYEFSFADKVRTLWTDIPKTGPGFIRKWERRYALTSEYLVKAGYGWLIEKATHASYERPISITAVVAESDGSQTLHLLPRYEPFTPAATQLARSGVTFTEVAGNRSNAGVLISVLVPQDWKLLPGSAELFQQPIITQPGTRRVAFIVPVNKLAGMLRELDSSHTRIEHIFDY